MKWNCPYCNIELNFSERHICHTDNNCMFANTIVFSEGKQYLEEQMQKAKNTNLTRIYTVENKPEQTPVMGMHIVVEQSGQLRSDITHINIDLPAEDIAIATIHSLHNIPKKYSIKKITVELMD